MLSQQCVCVRDLCTQVGEMEGPLKDGWGLTTDGKQLIATDSSATVFFIDPETLKVCWYVT